MLQNTNLQNTNNFYIPDTTNRCIYDIHNKTFYPGLLENGHNMYLIEIPDLKPLLRTSKYLMDETTGQFYAVFGNSYQHMCTIPRLLHTWEPDQLINEINTTRHAFGFMESTGSAPAPTKPAPTKTPSMTNQEEQIPDLVTQTPPPRMILYHPPSFKLDRPTRWLTKEERLEVHHNYISAVSKLEHKKDLINRLKRSEPHNIWSYEAKMTCHMALHNDVLGRIHTILKQDDYFKTLEDLPVIDNLQAYDDIQLFPELFDTANIIERVTSEADLMEKQLNRRGIYPFTSLPSTSNFVPRPNSIFRPISPITGQQSNEASDS